jgi:hypothetical protein
MLIGITSKLDQLQRQYFGTHAVDDPRAGQALDRSVRRLTRFLIRASILGSAGHLRRGRATLVGLGGQP